MKLITSNNKQAKINRNNIFSNCTIDVLQMIVYFKIKTAQLQSKQLHLSPFFMLGGKK